MQDLATNRNERPLPPEIIRLLLATCLIVASLAGCVDSTTPVVAPDPGAPVDRWYTGEHGELIAPENFTRFGDLTQVDLPRVGEGIWVEEGILFHTNGADLHVVDVRDPRNMALIGNFTDLPGARDVDLLDGNGSIYAVVAGSGNGTYVLDVTDPTRPAHISTASVLNAGGHNLAAVDGPPFAYVSGAGGGRIDVGNLSDPFEPTTTFFTMSTEMAVNGIPGVPLERDGCHDIAVRVDLARAYCAGGGKYYGAGGETFIGDISEAAGGPTNPAWIAAIDDPRVKYHHQAFVNDDGSIIIINDEYVGPYVGAVPVGANSCFDAGPPLVGSEDQIPLGAAWIYSLADESAPEQLSYVQNPLGWNGEGVRPSPLEGNCRVHFGDIIAGHDAFVMAWYEGGTILVDFTDPRNPEIMDIAPMVACETWGSMYYDGWVFHASGDLVATQLV